MRRRRCLCDHPQFPTIMRQLFSIGLLQLLLVVSTGAAVNLITENPGFEAGDVRGWQTTFDGTYNQHTGPGGNYVFLGDYAARRVLYGGTNAGTSISFIGQPYAIEAGETLVFTLVAAATGQAGRLEVFGALEYLNASKQVIGVVETNRATSIAGEYNWRYLTAEATTPPGTAYFRVVGRGYVKERLDSSAYMIWDAFSVVRASELPPDDGGPVKVHMHPNGDDRQDGLTPQTPIQTLNRAQLVVRALGGDRDVDVVIHPGRYRGQQVIWTYANPEHTIRFLPPEDTWQKPIFDGELENGSRPGGTWFNLNYSAGTPTRLHFHRLHIQNYQTAMSFNGNRDQVNGYNGNNRIEECVFQQIGNVMNPSLSYSTAVVRLVNSKGNVIHNNDFIDAINVSSPGLIHALYIAHMSDLNVITQNRFINNSGDPVRVRDYSNYNYIADNVHIAAGDYGYSEWYCDHDGRDDCTKSTPECPSWGNEYRNNVLQGAYGGGDLSVFAFFQPDSTSGCGRPDDSSPRLRTSGNVKVPAGKELGPYQLWLHRHFSLDERRTKSLSDPEASFANDGIANITKYVLGLPLREPHTGKTLPEVVWNQNDKGYRLTRDEAASPLQVEVQFSEDMKSWRPLDPAEFNLEEWYVDPLSGVVHYYYHLQEPWKSRDAFFMRIVVDYDGEKAWNPW